MTNKDIIKEVVKEIRREEREKKNKEIYHNTRLLMKNYNSLKVHGEKSKDSIEALEGQNIDISNLNEDEIYILSIKRSKAKTLIMIAHIDFALDALKKRQYNLYQSEKYEALKLYYIKEKTYENIAECLNCSVISVRRWINEMIKELSVFLFGVEGLKI